MHQQEELPAATIPMVDGKEEFSIRFDKEDDSTDVVVDDDPLQKKSMGNLGGDEIARRIKSKLT